MAQLTITLNNQIVKRITLAKPNYLIGRNTRCDIVLPERTVSSQHARLVIAGDDCFLEDLDSTNGIFVNGQRSQKHLLMDEDMVIIGKYQLLFNNTASLATQLRQLSIHPRLLDNRDRPMLEIIGGRKSGHVIPLLKDQLHLGEQGVGKITIERNQSGDYLLHSFNEKKVKTVAKLQHQDAFELGEIELRFHHAAKAATL